MFCGQFVRSRGEKVELWFPRVLCVPGSRVSFVSLVSVSRVVQPPEIPCFLDVAVAPGSNSLLHVQVVPKRKG